MLDYLDKQGMKAGKGMMGRWVPWENLDVREMLFLVSPVTGGVQELLV